MENRKIVALLLGEVEKPDQKHIVDGFVKQMMEADTDVCIFAMNQMYQNSTDREIGDSKIFSLIPYEKFDAFVVLADTIQTPGILDQLEVEIKTYFAGPVLFVDKKTPNFPYIHMDDYGLSKKMISHLIEDHGYQDIAYLMGKSWNDHAKARLSGYMDCMAEHDIPVRMDRIFEGDFWYTSGDSMVERLMKTPDDLPQVIACANNCMAIGVATALEKHGKKVPDDIAVVGFDYSLEGLLSPSPVTAIYMPYDKLGTAAGKSILSMMDGEGVKECRLNAPLFLGHSCGCTNPVDYTKMLKRRSWESANAKDGFDARYNSILEDLMSQDKLADFYNMVSSYAYQIPSIESFYLCLNPYWRNEESLVAEDNDWTKYDDDMLLAVKYIAGKEEGAQQEYNERIIFPTPSILPDMQQPCEHPRIYLINPVFFEDRTMGYAVAVYSETTEKHETIYPRWLMHIMRGLESMRKTVLASQAKKLLKDTTYTDIRTGLPNYKGLLKNASERAIEEGGKPAYVSALALDIKGLAKINELYGRDEGTEVILVLADYVKSIPSAQFYCCLGNDEFILVSSLENSIDKMKMEIQEKIDKFNENSQTYKLAIHMGEASASVANDEQMERLVNEAVMIKNGNKAKSIRQADTTDFTDEEKKVLNEVESILDENKFVYHFQPIISAKTGDIYSYEALMRSNGEIRVSPLDILKYAEALGRLEDVE